MLKKEVAVLLFQHLCEHKWHGYSQVKRWGDGEGTCDILIDGVTYKVEQGDRDCSSAIISVFEAAGISCGGATYTGNMKNCMVSTGNFKWNGMDFIAKRGDVYLNHQYHTAMCMSDVPDLLGEFSISENGTIDGVTGDQTGKESYIHPYYNYPWNGILECINFEESGANKKTKTYKVNSGDNLTLIAVITGSTIDGIVKANNIQNANLIYPGQILIIP